MQFMLYCLDKPGAAGLRAEHRGAHLEYLERHAAKISAAGPLLTEDGNGMIGSLLIFEVPSRKAVEDFAAGDPYAKAGLFQSVTITPWRRVLWQS
jgi:uncharacterized protein YciI